MHKIMKWRLLPILMLYVATLCAQPRTIVWDAADYPAILQVHGAPQVIQTVLGPAVEFNGSTDGVFVNEVPVKGMDEVTLEVIFNQYGDAAFEQRFLHIGQVSGPRIMFETRVTPEKRWYLDVFVVMVQGSENAIVIDEQKTHPADRWYNATLVASGDSIRAYVNGELQGVSPLRFRQAIAEGVTSIGVRQNLRSWFRGAIYKVRVTPKALKPEEFLKDYETLNNALTK